MRVVFGVTSRLFLLGVTIKSYLTKYIVLQIAVVALKTLLWDINVDDIVTSFRTMEEGLEFYFEFNGKNCIEKNESSYE